MDWMTEDGYGNSKKKQNIEKSGVVEHLDLKKKNVHHDYQHSNIALNCFSLSVLTITNLIVKET